MSQRRHPAQARHGFRQDLQPLAVKLGRKQADAGDVAARLCQRGDKAFADQILAHAIERDGTGRGLKHAQIGLGTAEDHLGLGLHQRCRAFGDLLGSDAVGAGDDQVLAFDEAVAAQLVEEGLDGSARGGNEYAEAIDTAGFLAVCRER